MNDRVAHVRPGKQHCYRLTDLKGLDAERRWWLLGGKKPPRHGWVAYGKVDRPTVVCSAEGAY